MHGPLLLEQPQICRAAAQMPPCDWLLVGLKHQQPGAGAAHRSGRSTRLQGGGTAERAGCGGCAQAISAGQRAPAGRPVCDLCTSCRAGVVEHQALGGSTLATFRAAGHDPQAQQVLLGEMVEMFRRAGDSSPMPSLAQARWMKAGVERAVQRPLGSARRWYRVAARQRRYAGADPRPSCRRSAPRRRRWVSLPRISRRSC